jgi:hypothetical protein
VRRLALTSLTCGAALLLGCGRGGGAAGPAPWPAEFAPYPGARRLCSQVTPAGALRVRWTTYAVADAPATVAAFYARTHGGDPAARPFVVRGRGRTTLAVHDAAASDYPRCTPAPTASERAIILATTAASRFAKEPR